MKGKIKRWERKQNPDAETLQLSTECCINLLNSILLWVNNCCAQLIKMHKHCHFYDHLICI